MPDRQWLVTILSSLKPHYIKSLVEYAENLRIKEVLPNPSNAEIEISSEYLQLFKKTRSGYRSPQDTTKRAKTSKVKGC